MDDFQAKNGKQQTQQAFFKLLTKWQAPVENMPDIVVNPLKELQKLDYILEMKKPACQEFLDQILKANVQKWRLPEW